MKCILHIGTEKTGTTSLQEFFHLNRTCLREHGYAFCRSSGEKNDFWLAIVGYEATRVDELTINLGIDSPAALSVFQNQVVTNLRKELATFRLSDTAIFSSEHFQSRLTTRTELSRLKIALEQLGFDEFKVVVYLRPQTELASSLYSTAVKCGATILAPPLPDDEYFGNVCDHCRTLSRFADIFGEGNVLPRLFMKDELRESSIISDFLYCTGISLN